MRLDLFKHTHTIAQRPRNRIHAHAHTGSAQPSAAKGDQHTGLNAHTAAVSVCDRERVLLKGYSLSLSLAVLGLLCAVEAAHALFFSLSLTLDRARLGSLFGTFSPQHAYFRRATFALNDLVVELMYVFFSLLGAL